MKLRTGFILLIGFGTLLILIGLLALSAFWKAEQIYAEMFAIHDTFRKADSALDGIHADVYTASILIRDFLMEPAPADVEWYRAEFVVLRASTDAHLKDLNAIMGQADASALDRLRREIGAYWSSRDFIFDWTPQQKSELGLRLLRNVIPHREAVIRLTREIDDLNAANLQKERERISQSKSEYRRYMSGVVFAASVISLLVAAGSYFRITHLERISEKERSRIEQAEQELRNLSQRLVYAQEEERKTISRELHDEIGQMLTGLRLELRNLDELRNTPGPEFSDHLAETKGLAEKSLRAVRDLAMGLRPSMLDDLGLGPALQWQAREFSRHNGIPAHMEIDGDLEDLSDRVRTCVYRLVQESLTNCARHAQARSVRIAVHGSRDNLAITVQDDGRGFSPATSYGIGLIGMEERVRELGGTLSVSSQPGKGTVLQAAIPLTGEQAYEQDRHSSG